MDTAKNNPVSGNRYFWGLLLLLVAFTGLAAFRFSGKDNFSMARQQILLRKIGHEILLASGDSTSRVLPVQEKGIGKYQIRFEKEFTFEPDTLVKIIRETLEKEDHPADYIVNVLDCSNEDILFGYAISQKGQNDIIPCKGRIQAKGCYVVNIEFQESDPMLSKSYVIAGASLFAFMGILAVRPFRKRRRRSVIPEPEQGFRIGNTLFDAEKRTLTVSGMITELTPKENKLLHILANSPNEVIERSRIQKEIWEDEGVIVGRSLDMFISKLRRKLENDPSVQLVNIHGKGYKLQIESV
ncbi:winged helix-turn-helix domain-containing protein [Sediminibacterium ginsengisoli]|uniref:Transcriptional regulatory protein, C terminal n=1 Tax=Sediminibacterium ginsengisoli TaxID=413434 RepID=A0A1T4R595_9BACT|nr:winged helix-turn-helix domain-containing protein [Sediminibacterium ginsengisoli]SKA11045.1 Transcriptional regulatory protein, C terminal [Sediminibacterium ginsengisoli]